MPLLRVVKGRSTAEEFSFEESVTIGRSADCRVRVFDEAASRHHAEVRREGADWVAVDNASANGLFVNGRRVERQALRTGDEIAVRNLVLLFLGDGAVDRPTVVSSKRLDIASHIEKKTAMVGAPVGGKEEELLGRLAALYRFHGILSEPRARLRELIPAQLEEIFAPARAALVLPEGDQGRYSRSVVDHVLDRGEAILVREPAEQIPQAQSLITERILSAIAAPIGDFGVLYVDRRENEFTRDDLELLTSIASAATPALRPPAAQAKRRAGKQKMLGESPPMRALKDEIAQVAAADATALITGETGTGKELVARALHTQSSRSRGPFVAVNCAAFVDTLLEAELFGHEKGAFTGADRARPGRFEQAHKGTLFLDEVGELAPGLQAKLLRVLETREFHRVGATKPTRVDVRIVAATNRDLKGGDFRDDLYYRLGVVTLHCPNLKDRGDDIRMLAERFIAPKKFTDAALEKLANYGWPGNVRELSNVCERCSVLARGDVVDADALPLEVRLGKKHEETKGAVPTLKEMEKEMVIRALDATGGNRTKAAALLGITYPTLKKKIDDFGI
ncbi:MAG: sigma 54-interacting transcriptional regulator [Planctomycetota bacterium]|jgi:DNA-binding NtrC family response regulator